MKNLLFQIQQLPKIKALLENEIQLDMENLLMRSGLP